MQNPHRNSVTLVLGGVRSGKSRFALDMASSAEHVTFVATARLSDDEMRCKIERHRQERPAQWSTREEPLKLDEAIDESEGTSEWIIVDCLTLFAANLLEAHGENQDAIWASINALCLALKKTNRPVVLVSNEVGSGIVPAYAAGRLFRDLLGEINQRVAALAGNVVLMVAGLPVWLKGSLEGLQ
jgi:adenosylcobinamide kinase/adenosylcobinamide-phosphate guanylyltransferase